MNEKDELDYLIRIWPDLNSAIRTRIIAIVTFELTSKQAEPIEEVPKKFKPVDMAEMQRLAEQRFTEKQLRRKKKARS